MFEDFLNSFPSREDPAIRIYWALVTNMGKKKKKNTLKLKLQITLQKVRDKLKGKTGFA